MTVVAAEVNGEKTTILLSMHDKIAKRLDETTDLFDSYSICTPYDQSGGCSLVSYRYAHLFPSEQTQMAEQLDIERMEKLNGEKSGQ